MRDYILRFEAILSLYQVMSEFHKCERYCLLLFFQDVKSPAIYPPWRANVPLQEAWVTFLGILQSWECRDSYTKLQTVCFTSFYKKTFSTPIHLQSPPTPHEYATTTARPHPKLVWIGYMDHFAPFRVIIHQILPAPMNTVWKLKYQIQSPEIKGKEVKQCMKLRINNLIAECPRRKMQKIQKFTFMTADDSIQEQIIISISLSNMNIISLSWQKSNKMTFPGECSRIQGRSTVLSQIKEGGSIIIIYFYNSGHKINCPTMVKFHSSFQE